MVENVLRNNTQFIFWAFIFKQPKSERTYLKQFVDSLDLITMV